MPLSRLLPLALAALLAGCQPWPDPAIPQEAQARTADWPVLAPLPPRLAQGAAIEARPPAPPAATRVSALNARAAALRGRTVVDGGSRQTMSRGVDLRGLPPPTLN